MFRCCITPLLLRATIGLLSKTQSTNTSKSAETGQGWQDRLQEPDTGQYRLHCRHISSYFLIKAIFKDLKEQISGRSLVSYVQNTWLNPQHRQKKNLLICLVSVYVCMWGGPRTHVHESLETRGEHGIPAVTLTSFFQSFTNPGAHLTKPDALVRKAQRSSCLQPALRLQELTDTGSLFCSGFLDTRSPLFVLQAGLQLREPPAASRNQIKGVDRVLFTWVLGTKLRSLGMANALQTKPYSLPQKTILKDKHQFVVLFY